MRNGVVRRDMLFLMVLTAGAGDVVKKKGYEILKVGGPFVVVSALEEQLKSVIPDNAKRQRELQNTAMVVNRFLPVGYPLLAPELKLWIACQVVLRIVSTGWRPPNDEASRDFVQRLYDLAGSMQLDRPPSSDLVEFVVHSAEKLRTDHRLFFPA